MTQTVEYSIDTATEYPSTMYNAPMALFADIGTPNEKQIALLGMGTHDAYDLTVDDDGTATITTQNTGLGYASIQVIDLATGETISDISLSGDDYNADECDDMGWDELRDHLSQWCE